MERQGRIYESFDSRRTPPESRIDSKFLQFEIPNIHLEGTDRRILSSSVESLVSRNEDLILRALSFFRDILLTDFPPETFIQESSLSQSLLQVVKDSWEDPMVSYGAFQSLLQLANSLHISIGFLDSVEFYQQPSAVSQNFQRSTSSELDDFGSRGYTDSATRHGSTEHFLTNYFHLLTGISRTLTYKPGNTYLWLLLQSYSSLLQKYLSLYQGSSVTTLHLSIEEILLDISQAFLSYIGIVHPPTVAAIMGSLLSNLSSSETKLMTADVRRAIWALASNTELSRKSYSSIRSNFIQEALPFEFDLKKALDVNANDDSAQMFRSASWWKLDVINEQRAWKDNPEINDIMEVLPAILFSIQNAVDHTSVIDGIDKLWLHLLPYITMKNSDLGQNSDSSPSEELWSSKCQWRETFYRFLSVEPTLSEDVDLLCRILDVMSFILCLTPNLGVKSSRSPWEWIVSLVTEKNSAMLRLLYQESAQCISSGGTNLTTLNSSLFDLYFAIIYEGNYSNQLGEFFNICAEIIKMVYEAQFPSTGILHIVLKALSNLVRTKLIEDKLKENPEVTLSLVDIVSNAIGILVQNMSDGCYKNFGGIQYGTIILCHLTQILMSDSQITCFWIPHCVSIPSFWMIENPIIRASALQICSNITSTKSGVIALISHLESPALLWRFAYTRLTDPTEASVVKERCATVLLNLMKHWSQMRILLGPQLEIPSLKLSEEISTFISNVSWQSRISDSKNCGRFGKNVPLITPNALSLVSIIIVKVFENSTEEQIQLFQGNISLLRETITALSRVLGSFRADFLDYQDPTWRDQSLLSLTNATQALISTLELDSTLSLNIIADKQNLSNVISYFGISSSNDLTSKSTETVFSLWKNVFVLLCTILVDSGQNFEDLERLIWGDGRNVLFGKVIDWLDVKVPSTYRKSALEFLSTLLGETYLRKGASKETEGPPRSYFCEPYGQSQETLGAVLCTKLLKFLTHSSENEERSSILHALNHICLLSPSAHASAIQNNCVKQLVAALRDIGIKALDYQLNNKKSTKFLDETKWLLTVLSTLFCESSESKSQAIEAHFGDALHTVLKIIKPQPNLVQETLECLINFMAEFPGGSQSLTLTTGVVGVPSRKISSPNSLYIELLSMLQLELDSIDRNPNLNVTTIELLFSFINNSAISIECRNILAKTRILNFLSKYHGTELRKWSFKYSQVKTLFLKNLLQISVYPDIQILITKIPDSIGILIWLSKNEVNPNSLYALQILRNLSFHSSNRPRLLHEVDFLKTLGLLLTESWNMEELECVAVSLWALTANSEKGKVAAKQASCSTVLQNTLQRLQMKKHSLASGDPSTSNLVKVINLLEKVSTVQKSSDKILI